MKRMITSSAKFPLTYRDYDIEHNLYGKGEYTVQYCGDDIWFDSLDEAKLYIDDIWKREIECSDDIKTYQNRRNENKFIETKKYDDGHTVARQYMKWNTPEGEVKNYSGAKDARRGRWHRAGQHTRDMMLEDYDEITSAEYVADDFSNDKVGFNSDCEFTENQFKWYSDVLNEFGDWLEAHPLVEDWAIDVDNYDIYILLVTAGGYVNDTWSETLEDLPDDKQSALKYLKSTADEILTNVAEIEDEEYY